MQITLPELGPYGWVTDPLRILNNGFAYICSSLHSQSNVFQGKIASMQYLTARYHNDPDRLASEAKELITEYFEKFFAEVAVDCRVQYMDDQGVLYSLNVDVRVRDNKGKSYTLAEALKIDNGSMKRVSAMINSGEG